MKDKELVWLPKEWADKIKAVENKEDLIDKEVLCYIKSTKRDISAQVENLDDDILMFKGKLASYKKAFKEAHESADTEMYSFWEDFDKDLSNRYKSMRQRMERMNKIYDEEFSRKKHDIEQISKKMEGINTYQFEKIISFLRQYENLNDSTKELFTKMLKERDK